MALGDQAPASSEAPEDVYRGELVIYPGPWGFEIQHPGIILVRDDELGTLASDPDKVINLSTGLTPWNQSLRQICDRARAQGQRTLTLAFDQFFAQYRPGQNTPRRLMPDMDEYIQKMAAIGRFAAGYGLGLELSLLSPLEVGQAYAARTGESGVWMHYREGLHDPKTGAFSVQLWQHKRWVNNKGPIDIHDAGVRVFAFRETPVPGTPYRCGAHRRDQRGHWGRTDGELDCPRWRFPGGAHPRARPRCSASRGLGSRPGGSVVSDSGDGLLQPQGAAFLDQPRG
jgi:hypothetical protein